MTRYLIFLLLSCALLAQTRHALRAGAGATGSAGWLNVQDFGAAGDGSTDDAAAIQGAIDQAVGAGGGIVYFPPGKYFIARGLKIQGSNIALQGSGKDATTILGGIPVDWSISALSTTMKTNIEIRDLTMDTNNGRRASAIQVGYVNGFALRRCRIQNVAAQGWGLYVGVPDASDAEIHNFNIVVEDSDFDTLAGTLEEALIFNSANVHFSRDTFANSPDGPAIGFWQNVDNATVQDCSFTNNFNAVYYSQATNNLVFRNLNTTASVKAGIRGANQSDRGAFGATTVHNVQIIGGTYSANGVCIELGAVDGASVIGTRFYQCGAAGLVINDGNRPAQGTPANIRVLGCEFIENNQRAVAPLLNPGLFINASVQNLLITGNVFHDSQATPTQLYPITANGSISPTNVVITGNRLSAYGSGVSVQTLAGASFVASYAMANTDYKPSAAISAGLSATKTIKGSDGANCTLTITTGIITATTCP